jgi:hypothetical protein
MTSISVVTSLRASLETGKKRGWKTREQMSARAIKAVGDSFIAGLIVAGALFAADSGDGAFTPAQLTALPTTDWITNGGNVFNQRYSPLKQLDRTNVKELKAVWRASWTAPAWAARPQARRPGCRRAGGSFRSALRRPPARIRIVFGNLP